MHRLTDPSSRLFYGWIIVLVCGLTLLVAFGVRLSFSVFFVVLLDDFAWSRANTALIFSINMLVFAIFSTPAGMALDRWGVRRVFGIGAGLLGLGLLLSSRVQSLPQLIITYGIIVGLGITILGLGPQASVISRWFVRRRGMAIGLAFAGTGVGAMVLIPVTAVLVSAIGWRGAYMALAILALAMIPAIVYFLRLSPARIGLYPDGEKPSPHYPQETDASTPGGWKMAEVVRSPAFWLVILASLGAIGPLRMLTVHQLAAIESAGVDRLFAATIIGLTGAIATLAFIFWGSLSDRIGRRVAYLLGSLCMLMAIIILGNLGGSSSTGWLFGYALMLGLGEGSRSLLVTAVASDLFPGNALGAVNGAVGSAFGAGAALFPWLAGRIFDQSGSYTSAFQLAAVAIIISTMAFWLAPVLAKRKSQTAAA
jgi:MFS family permease